MFTSSYTKLTAPPKPYTILELEVTSKEVGNRTKERPLSKKSLNNLMASDALNVKAMATSRLIVRT